jgi:hypothetical protein
MNARANVKCKDYARVEVIGYGRSQVAAKIETFT